MEKQKKKIVYKVLVKASDTSILIGDLAKIIKQNGYDIGQNKLFCWLRENGYLIKVGERRNLPTQRAIEKSNGKKKIVMTTKVTEKGQKYFWDQF